MALGAAEIISKIRLFILMIYAARLLGVVSFGKFTFALAFSMLTIILSDLGINTLLIREISRKKDLANKYFINAFAGFPATILCGVTIGENSIVGAGAVVTKDVPPNSIVAGNPAKVIGKVKDLIK